MKSFFVALLALPAALAVPTVSARADFPTTYPFEAQACRCDDGQGHVTVSSCLYFGSVADGQWCYPSVSWHPRTETRFTDAYCFESTGSTRSKAVCKPIKLCKNPAIPDDWTETYYVLC
ncbi:hypothetical protein B0I37DRAFT_165796 [Chaetomium sp. MPI-CAGE-AT-0009]|nr:hypothetical protein B0I37DRAFT_165796 [Chaetomium sp. MPI-CAGE-AT-0009]